MTSKYKKEFSLFNDHFLGVKTVDHIDSRTYNSMISLFLTWLVLSSSHLTHTRLSLRYVFHTTINFTVFTLRCSYLNDSAFRF